MEYGPVAILQSATFWHRHACGSLAGAACATLEPEHPSDADPPPAVGNPQADRCLVCRHASSTGSGDVVALLCGSVSGTRRPVRYDGSDLPIEGGRPSRFRSEEAHFRCLAPGASLASGGASHIQLRSAREMKPFAATMTWSRTVMPQSSATSRRCAVKSRSCREGEDSRTGDCGPSVPGPVMWHPAGPTGQGASSPRHQQHGCWQRLPAGVHGRLQRAIRHAAPFRRTEAVAHTTEGTGPAYPVPRSGMA